MASLAFQVQFHMAIPAELPCSFNITNAVLNRSVFGILVFYRKLRRYLFRLLFLA